MQGREAGVRPAALELHKQGFLRWAGEVPCAFEGAISATRTLFFLEERVKSDAGQVLHVKTLSFIQPYLIRYHIFHSGPTLSILSTAISCLLI